MKIHTLLLLLISPAAYSTDRISPAEAKSRIGQIVSVCGKVSSATYATGSNNKPTFINIGPAYPNHIFTAVIWDGQRSRFSYRPETLKGKNICVTGKVESYRGIAQIEPGTEKNIIITN
jgi:DNA/RNA endonuclease YhcR with UshA esterase domain